MNITGINQTDYTSNGSSQNYALTDSYSKSIENQIALLQEKMQRISSNDDLTFEEKLEQRQEITQEIAALQAELVQHEIELRNKSRMQKSSSDGEQQNKQQSNLAREEAATLDISNDGMESLISAGYSLEMSKVAKRVSSELDGKARVLESEINQDAASGGSSTVKHAELGAVRAKANSAYASMGGYLDEVNTTVMDSYAGIKKTEHKRATETNEDDTKEVKAGAEEESAVTRSL